MEHCITIPQDQLSELIEKARDFALLNGLCMRSKNEFNQDSLQCAPFILLPSPFPRKVYNQACDMQIILNSLINLVANDYKFLKESFKEIIEIDEFTKKLFDIYETVYNEGFAQDISLTLLRSDFMLSTSVQNCNENKAYCCWKQVEINTIASGHGWMGPTSTKLHYYVLQQLNLKDHIKNLPVNNALVGLCSAINDAWKMYNNPSAAVLFIVEDIAYNICDQRAHEYEISRQNPNIKVLRKTLTELILAAKLDVNKKLIVDGHCIAVAYFRSAYSPEQYCSNQEWDVRLLIERSNAIKCPSIQYHLAGTKKIQQILAKPGMVCKLLKDSQTASQVEEIFAALPDAIQAVAKYEVGNEPREIYFFREGTTVMWNITDLECSNLLQFLKQYEETSYSYELVQAEGEIMLYTYTDNGKRSHLKEGDIFLSPGANLDKYTFSNAISQSVKLGIWEASLDHYVDSIEFITEDLKAGRKIKMSRQEVLRKQGELFALRHLINLSSDLLDTPDFYWERDDLETLYQQTCAYFSIAKRTRVMNEKLNHCVELVELLSSHLSDRHHVRLEWMIIVLIMVEVGFEILHYTDRYLAKQENQTYES